ncbi:MAG: aminotransferase class I/II-fold pyridoxal phosphate-dependent enzyme [Burkholderiales bacterium]|nr:MAG: aminotransferase class I/II-fold pyridoxal phosphate-dependent enzyme [Burkholderiales bacterium]
MDAARPRGTKMIRASKPNTAASVASDDEGGRRARRFRKPFTQQEPLPEAAVARAVEVMRSGRLHRYNTLPGQPGEAAELEQAFAQYMQLPYCLACTSCGYALHIALRSAGVSAGDPVLCNAYTLSPVPGAIDNAGGKPVFVETCEDCTVDVADLRRAALESQARYFVLSHMRGHIADMDAIVALCRELGIVLIEDCAHTMGARWRGRLSGSFGDIACFSTQTYKHMNSGEGGLLVCADPAYMRRAVLYSGSYMFYDRHPQAPPPETFVQDRLTVPNYSGRMDNLRAAVLLAQLPLLDANCRRWNALYQVLESGLARIPGIAVIERPAHEAFVGSSIQFRLTECPGAKIPEFVRACAERGVVVKWFGAEQPEGYTSRYDSWRYVTSCRPLPRTTALLAGLCDIRIPLTFDTSDCELITELIGEALGSIAG